MTDKIHLPIEVVKNLVAEQFPQWSNLQITPVKNQGWDNYSYRLGKELLIRLPSHKDYICAVKKEQHWLPRLAPHLNLQIPTPVAQGTPNDHFPYPWSIYRWISGVTFTPNNADIAVPLAGFLKQFHSINAAHGPKPGPENFYRGGDLAIYSDQTHEAIRLLKDKIDTQKALAIWQTALNSSWQQKPVWVHGDISMGNLLIDDGELSAVIDFGQMCVGDPACDLVGLWTFLDPSAAIAFKDSLNIDSQTWQRARGWALWKFLIVEAGLTSWDKYEGTRSAEILARVLDYE